MVKLKIVVVFVKVFVIVYFHRFVITVSIGAKLRLDERCGKSVEIALSRWFLCPWNFIKNWFIKSLPKWQDNCVNKPSEFSRTLFCCFLCKLLLNSKEIGYRYVYFLNIAYDENLFLFKLINVFIKSILYFLSRCIC